MTVFWKGGSTKSLETGNGLVWNFFLGFFLRYGMLDKQSICGEWGCEMEITALKLMKGLSDYAEELKQEVRDASRSGEWSGDSAYRHCMFYGYYGDGYMEDANMTEKDRIWKSLSALAVSSLWRT